MTGLESPWHILLVLLVALLVFGPKRLPELGRTLGHGIRDFREAVSGADRRADDEQQAVLSAAPADEAESAPTRES